VGKILLLFVFWLALKGRLKDYIALMQPEKIQGKTA
jgi:hypothetical protein